MDRRSVLVGSGTALTLALAGCMEGDDGDDSDEPENDVRTGGDTGDNGDSNGDDTPDDTFLDIDADELDELTDAVTVRDIVIEDRTLKITADLTVDSKKKGMTDLGDGMKKGISDVHALKKKVDWVMVVLYDKGEKVFTAKVNVDWIVKLVEEEVDTDELWDYIDDGDGDD
ncbi:hypothetical protein Halru_2285 [Halovivax ruber XH-70]|uniref:Lipoprotein n=1 Tax=Halovivax ruber (strain DSM 18193 / JCM 13892 / XH-70) TaxID=797302 RepID=L0IF95_HALRX|nr:hypothetical protein [Halovivax ruber]AGB16871.1 hypothetical protein Halru_2285 [Halovivax ruber XH-70]